VYRRREVRDLLIDGSTAVDHPSDALALVSALRSPDVGVWGTTSVDSGRNSSRPAKPHCYQQRRSSRSQPSGRSGNWTTVRRVSVCTKLTSPTCPAFRSVAPHLPDAPGP